MSQTRKITGVADMADGFRLFFRPTFCDPNIDYLKKCVLPW